ncbi:hypothetical protein FD754_018835 [Muntiacus muntjak]|uniref:Uncharacterized protein n=1 Tax=Muntiacus muntjak TaxID=9888 RepID=A0A5N3UYP1_MUNMU|nr:hypothetical protein FD754_018835 [Muntiacus muntjak]
MPGEESRTLEEMKLFGSLYKAAAGDCRFRRLCDIGEGGFILLRIQERLAREGIKNKILYESAHHDPERKQINGSSSSN